MGQKKVSLLGVLISGVELCVRTAFAERKGVLISGVSHCIICLVRVVETGKDESDKVFVHELIVCLSPHVDVTWPHSDVRVTVVPSQDLRSVSPRIKKRGGGGGGGGGLSTLKLFMPGHIHCYSLYYYPVLCEHGKKVLCPLPPFGKE